VYASPRGLLYALVLLLLIGLSLSRICFIVGILLLLLSKLGVVRKQDIVQVDLLSIVAGLLLFVPLRRVPKLAGRFMGNDKVGDVAAGDAALNTNGRSVVWAVVLDDFTRSPWVGRGAGSASDMLTDLFAGDIDHTHNEYLRFLHDYGVIGLALLLTGLGGLLRKCWRARWKAASDIP